MNTLFQVPETKHGGIGLYQCKDGYKLKGANTTECRYGNWTNTTPRCEEVYCKFPGTIENGKVIVLSVLKYVDPNSRFNCINYADQIISHRTIFLQ